MSSLAPIPPSLITSFVLPNFWTVRQLVLSQKKSLSYNITILYNHIPEKYIEWSKDAGVLATNTKIETSFSFPELHYNKLINQSLHVVDFNIDRYDMIIGRYLIISLGIDIHGADMTIHWDDTAIPRRNIDSTTNNVFVLLQ